MQEEVRYTKRDCMGEVMNKLEKSVVESRGHAKRLISTIILMGKQLSMLTMRARTPCTFPSPPHPPSHPTKPFSPSSSPTRP